MRVAVRQVEARTASARPATRAPRPAYSIMAAHGCAARVEDWLHIVRKRDGGSAALTLAVHARSAGAAHHSAGAAVAFVGIEVDTSSAALGELAAIV